MDVSKLQGFFNTIVPKIVVGTEHNTRNVQRPSVFQKRDSFSKSDLHVSGKALASATDESKSVKESGPRLSRLLQDAANYYSAA
jgi:hypothetical protein